MSFSDEELAYLRSQQLARIATVSSDGTVGGPTDAMTNLVVASAWAPFVQTPTRIIRYSNRGHDVALLFLQSGNFGPVSNHGLYQPAPTQGMNFLAYGRGIFALATGAGNTATPAQRELLASTSIPRHN